MQIPLGGIPLPITNRCVCSHSRFRIIYDFYSCATNRTVCRWLLLANYRFSQMRFYFPFMLNECCIPALCSLFMRIRVKVNNILSPNSVKIAFVICNCYTRCKHVNKQLFLHRANTGAECNVLISDSSAGSSTRPDANTTREKNQMSFHCEQ